jgi:hypothetical protein
MLDTLMARGYFPADDAPAGANWIELTAGPRGVVRVVVEDGTAEIYVNDARSVNYSQARLTGASPAMFDAVLAAAESDASQI